VFLEDQFQPFGLGCLEEILNGKSEYIFDKPNLYRDRSYFCP
jgi:hypothetical protein